MQGPVAGVCLERPREQKPKRTTEHTRQGLVSSLGFGKTQEDFGWRSANFGGRRLELGLVMHKRGPAVRLRG